MNQANFEYKFTPSIYKNEREEIVAEFVENINLLRGKKYKPITAREVAIRLNSNKFLAKDDGECRLLLKKCLDKNSFAFFFYCCPLNKVDK